MNFVFGDTVHFIALLSKRDRWHDLAVSFQHDPPGPLLTTEWILTEVGDAFSEPEARPRFLRLLELMDRQPDVEIVPATHELFRRGVERFGQRMDKDWSLTDYVSFVVMNDRGITHALTHDHHYEQAGFQILLK